jgi:hypothetical protein
MGKEAAQWKEKYIDAFNQMEAALRSRDALPSAVARSPRLEVSLAAMQASVAKLAEGMEVVLKQVNTTWRYIGLLEMHQKGHVKITPAVTEEIFRQHALGVSLADIARFCRVSRTSVSLIVNGKYPQTRALAEGNAVRPELVEGHSLSNTGLRAQTTPTLDALIEQKLAAERAVLAATDALNAAALKERAAIPLDPPVWLKKGY